MGNDSSKQSNKQRSSESSHRSSSSSRSSGTLAQEPPESKNDTSPVAAPQAVKVVQSSSRQTQQQQEKPPHPPPAMDSRIRQPPRRKVSIGTGNFEGRYKMGDTIAKGSTGKCYVCTSLEDGEDYCCKVIDKRRLAYSGGPQQWTKMKQLLQNEINVLKRLYHPNIIQLYHIEQTSNMLYIVMELMSGGELFDYIIDRGVLSEREASTIARQVASAVAYCHANGVAHRDLKPENLLLARHGDLNQVKIADFGFAKALGSKSTKSSLGTPGYVAPEITEGRPHTLAVDVWSMGVIFYVLMQGCLPFEPVEVVDWRSGAANLDPEASYTVDFVTDGDWSNISTCAKELLWRMLQYDPQQRISAGDVLLHPWVAGLQVSDAALPSVRAALSEENVDLNISLGTTIRRRKSSNWGAESVQSQQSRNSPDNTMNVSPSSRRLSIASTQHFGGAVGDGTNSSVTGLDREDLILAVTTDATRQSAIECGENHCVSPVSTVQVRLGVQAQESRQQAVELELQYAYFSQRGFDPEEPNARNPDTLAAAPYFEQGGESVSQAENASREAKQQLALFLLCDGHGSQGGAIARYARDAIQTNLRRGLGLTVDGATLDSNQSPSVGQDTSVDSKAEAAKTQGGLFHAEYRASFVTAHRQLMQLSRHGSSSGSASATTVINGQTVPNINANTSGAGCVAVAIRTGSLTGTNGAPCLEVAHVGESRVVLGVGSAPGVGVDGGVVAAVAMTIDHTLYRSDERRRVERARVLSIEQLHGTAPPPPKLDAKSDEDPAQHQPFWDPADPPRVWDKEGGWPGAVYTRCLGNGRCTDLGITAEPELKSRVLTGAERFVILGSDGLFAFLSSQAVVDIVAQFTDPLQACRTVVAQAYSLWLQFEVRTDNLTVLCVFFNFVIAPTLSAELALPAQAPMRAEAGGVEGKAAFDPSSSYDRKSVDAATIEATAAAATSVATAATATMAKVKWRPVRATLSHGMQRHLLLKSKSWKRSDVSSRLTPDVADDGTDDGDADETEEYIVREHVVEKTAAEMERIQEAVKGNFLFQHLSEPQMKAAFSVMRRVTIGVGECIIRQGDEGDCFYVVDRGDFAVLIDRSEGVESDSDKERGSDSTYYGDVVHVYHGSGSFGELALLYAKPRAASVVAVAPSATSEATSDRSDTTLSTPTHSLWALDRRAFRHILMRTSNEVVVRVLCRVPLLFDLGLSMTQIRRLATSNVFRETTYSAGECILKQGEVSDQLFIIVSGAARCTVRTQTKKKKEKRKSILVSMGLGKKNKSGSSPLEQGEVEPEAHAPEKEVMRLKRFDHFNDQALALHNTSGASMAVAVGQGVRRTTVDLQQSEMAAAASAAPVDTAVAFGSIDVPTGGKETVAKGNGAPAAFSIYAEGQTKCLQMRRRDFERELGPIEALLEAAARRRAIALGKKQEQQAHAQIKDDSAQQQQEQNLRQREAFMQRQRDKKTRNQGTGSSFKGAKKDLPPRLTLAEEANTEVRYSSTSGVRSGDAALNATTTGHIPEQTKSSPRSASEAVSDALAGRVGLNSTTSNVVTPALMIPVDGSEDHGFDACDLADLKSLPVRTVSLPAAVLTAQQQARTVDATKQHNVLNFLSTRDGCNDGTVTATLGGIESTLLSIVEAPITDSSTRQSAGHANFGLKSVVLQTLAQGGSQHHDAIQQERQVWALLSSRPADDILVSRPVTVPRLIATCVSRDYLHSLFVPPCVAPFSAVNHVTGGGLFDFFDCFLNRKASSESLPQSMCMTREDAARFYVGCAVTALEFFHARRILCRSLVPELLLLGGGGEGFPQGYLMIGDFRLAKDLGSPDGRTFTICGTPHYLSPEQATGQGHGLASDFWMLGIFLYELLTGTTPFTGSSSDSDFEIFERIVSHRFGRLQFPAPTMGMSTEPDEESHGGIDAGLSAEAVDVLQLLLHHDENARLGATHSTGSSKSDSDQEPLESLRAHAFFSKAPSEWGERWTNLARGLILPPALPTKIQITGLEVLPGGRVQIGVQATTTGLKWVVNVANSELMSVLEMIASKRAILSSLGALQISVSSIGIPETAVDNQKSTMELLRSVRALCYVVQSQAGCEVQVSRLFQLLQVPARCRQSVDLQTGGFTKDGKDWDWLRRF